MSEINNFDILYNTENMEEKKEITLHRPSTKAIGCCGQLIPNHQAVVLLFALLPKEQIVQDACTLKKDQPHSK
jgi:hypothetical protein